MQTGSSFEPACNCLNQELLRDILFLSLVLDQVMFWRGFKLRRIATKSGDNLGEWKGAGAAVKSLAFNTEAG